MTAFKITTLKAFIATEDDGTEGIVGMTMGEGFFMPFVCADDKRAEWLKPYAMQIASELGKKIQLAKFSIREDIEEICPPTTQCRDEQKTAV